MFSDSYDCILFLNHQDNVANNCHRKAVFPTSDHSESCLNSTQPQYYLGTENDMGPIVRSLCLTFSLGIWKQES